MSGLVPRFLLAAYRGLPEWLVRGIVMGFIGAVLAISFALLAVREVVQPARARVNRLRRRLPQGQKMHPQ